VAPLLLGELVESGSMKKGASRAHYLLALLLLLLVQGLLLEVHIVQQHQQFLVN
jgi:hypothetical protein